MNSGCESINRSAQAIKCSSSVCFAAWDLPLIILRESPVVMKLAPCYGLDSQRGSCFA